MRLGQSPLPVSVLACSGYTAALVVLAAMPHPPTAVPDVVAHAVGYGIHAGLMYWALATVVSPLGSPMAAWVTTSTLAGLTELLQTYWPPRTAELKDLVAGMAGAATVVVALRLARSALGAVHGMAGNELLWATAADGPPLATGRGSGSPHAAPALRATPPDEPPTAACVHCREPIRKGASRCPHCRAWQSRWAADSQSPRAELALLAGGVILVALFGIWLFRHEPQAQSSTRSFPQGSLTVHEVTAVPLHPDGKPALAILGTMTNPTATAWRDAYLLVSCFDNQGQAVETFASRAIGLVALPGTDTRFKVIETAPLRDPAEYARCDVEVRWAQTAP